MKLIQNNKYITSPISWNKLSCGSYYRHHLNQELKYWWPKIFGLYLLKIGSLSIELDTQKCAISHHINVGLLHGQYLQQLITDYDHLPFINKSVDACLIAHTLSYTNHPHILLREIDRILIDNGWLIVTTFNPISILGLIKLYSIIFYHAKKFQYRMYSQIKLIDLLTVLNFEIIYYNTLQILPWQRIKNKFLNKYLSGIGCLNIIIARKRVFPVNFISLSKVYTDKNVILVK